jgi:beta-glucanase (GH16 family)
MERQLLWSLEFDGAAGTPPSSEFWNYDIGDGTQSGIPGWGNQEREFYRPEAFGADGQGNMVISAQKTSKLPADEAETLDTYYGKAEWVSGKITTLDKVSFQYGRIEARIQMPQGDGTWPAFWLLGTDIRAVPWPACGEIDIVEVKGSEPNGIFGTLHGPGYSGDKGSGVIHELGAASWTGFNNYAIEWREDQIQWFVNDQLFLTRTPDDVAPNEWVYNKPFYMIVNLAMGGNFTGEIDPALTEAELKIDWIRHYSIDGVGRNWVHA